MANMPNPGDAAKAAQKASEAADKAAKAADDARKAASDAKKTADKIKAKAKQAADLAKQAYALAKDPAIREQAFAEAKRRAAAIEQQADKALGDASKAFRDAADGANQLYSGLADQIKAVGPGFVEEMVRQQIPAVPKLVPQGIAAKLGTAADALQQAAENIPAAVTSAAARAASAVKAPAMPAAPTSLAVSPCSAPTPTHPSVTQAQIDDIVDAVGKQFGEHPLRQEYMQKVRDLKPIADKMLDAGMREAEVAETISWLRRDLGEKYKELTPEPLQSYIKAVNEKRYQDALGPTYKAAKDRLKSNLEIIESACRPNEKVDKLLGGLKKHLKKLPADDIARLADKVKKLKP
jgi:hypothetical protein